MASFVRWTSRRDHRRNHQRTSPRTLDVHHRIRPADPVAIACWFRPPHHLNRRLAGDTVPQRPRAHPRHAVRLTAASSSARDRSPLSRPRPCGQYPPRPALRLATSSPLGPGACLSGAAAGAGVPISPLPPTLALPTRNRLISYPTAGRPTPHPPSSKTPRPRSANPEPGAENTRLLRGNRRGDLDARERCRAIRTPTPPHDARTSGVNEWRCASSGQLSYW